VHEALAGLFGSFGLKVDAASFKQADQAVTGLLGKVTGLQKESIGALRAGGFFGEGVKGIAGYTKALHGVAGVAQEVAGKVYDAFRGAFDQVGGLAGQLGSVARAGNQNTQELQATAHAASRAGVDLAELGATYQRIRSTQYATKFSTEANFAIQQLGVGVRDASGRFKSAEVFLEQAIEKLINVRDPAERTGKALAVVGQAGLDLANYFADKGIEAFRAYRREVKELGAELSTTDVQAVAGYRFEVSRLQLVLQGFRNAVAGPLHAALAGLAGQFADWLKGVQGPLRAGLRQAVAGLSQLAPALLSLGKGLVSLLPLFGTLVQFLGAAANVAATVASGIVNLGASLVNVGAEGKVAALTLFAAFFPMVALFGVIVAVLEDLIVFSRGGRSVFGAALDAFQNFRDRLTDGNFLGEGNGLTRFFKQLLKFLLVDVPAAIDFMINKLADLFRWVGQVVKPILAVLDRVEKAALTNKSATPGLGDVAGLALGGARTVGVGIGGLARELLSGRQPVATTPVTGYDPAAVDKLLATPQGRKAVNDFKAEINIIGARASEAKEIGEIAVKAVASWFEDSVLRQAGSQQ
jgi:hypothetical protein